MGTLIIGGIVLCVVILAARKVYKDRKNGAGCGCGCESCSRCPARPGGTGMPEAARE